MLRHNTELQELDLAATDLEDDGAASLAAALEFNTTLTRLRLPYNPALSDGAKAALLGAAERWCPALKVDL